MAEQERTGRVLEDARSPARLIGCSTARVYALVRADLLPCVRVGRRVYFDRAQLADFIASGGRALESDERELA